MDFKTCREEIASALNDFGNRWCKREYVEPNALKGWKGGIFKIVLVWFDFFFTALQHILGHFERGQLP